MKKHSQRFAVHAAAALVAACCLSPFAAVAQDYARFDPETATATLGMDNETEPGAVQSAEVKQPSYWFGYLEYEATDAGEQPVMEGFDWRDPNTGLVMGYDD